MERAVPTHVEPQQRDIALLRELFQTRLLTLAQAASLFFDGRSEAAKKRIQSLKRVGFIAERPRRVYEPSVLHLGRAGFKLLQSGGDLDAYPPTSWASFEKRLRVKDLTLRHELDVMDIKAAVVSAIRGIPNFQIAEFCTWPRRYEFEADQRHGRSVTVKPDGFIRIQKAASNDQVFEHAFFLEVDRSTETQETLVLKAVFYRDYYRSGRFAEKNGCPRSKFGTFPFRVLMIFQNAERRNNTAESLLRMRPPILSQVWLTTFVEVTSCPLGAIWVRPLDYQNALRETPFEYIDARASALYRRNAEREVVVESRVIKQAILATTEFPPT